VEAFFSNVAECEVKFNFASYKEKQLGFFFDIFTFSTMSRTNKESPLKLCLVVGLQSPLCFFLMTKLISISVFSFHSFVFVLSFVSLTLL